MNSFSGGRDPDFGNCLRAPKYRNPALEQAERSLQVLLALLALQTCQAGFDPGSQGKCRSSPVPKQVSEKESCLVKREAEWDEFIELPSAHPLPSNQGLVLCLSQGSNEDTFMQFYLTIERRLIAKRS